MGDFLNMGSRSTQLASAEVLLASAVDMATDAATILIDAGEEESAQEVKTPLPLLMRPCNGPAKAHRRRSSRSIRSGE